MTQLVTNGAQLTCSFGTIPSTFIVAPTKRVNAANMPVATVMDFIPLTNVMSFGMCITLSNPQVAAMTSAALGVLTPQPCMPVTTTPWVPGVPTVSVGGQQVLNNSCTLNCMWQGIITVANPGQQTVTVP